MKISLRGLVVVEDVLDGNRRVISPARCATVRKQAMNETEQRKAAHKRFQAQCRAVYDEVLEILFQIDPIGVHGQDTTEKFVPEATSILARLRDARFAEDVEQIVQQELRRWYGRRRLAHQDPDRLARATIAICSAWNSFLARSAL